MAAVNAGKRLVNETAGIGEWCLRWGIPERVRNRAMSSATVVAEHDRAAARLLGRMPRLIASAQDLEEGLRRSAELVAEAARADVAAIRLGNLGRPLIVHRRHEIGDAPIDSLPTRLTV